MRLIDVVTSPWALMPDKLVEIRGIYETHLRGEKIDLAGVEARLGRPLANEAKPYQVEQGVAIVPCIGVLAKRAGMFMDISGGTSTQRIGDMLDAAAQDPGVHAIVLEIDSPGGAVDGVQILADQIRATRQGKPVHAWITGMGASGGYWIAAACERVLISDRTTLVGSIGVVATHVDVSGAQAKTGVTTTEITAGQYKRIASNYAPLSEAGRATMQQQVDAIYEVFVNAVADGRGVSVETVLTDMADGRVFIGQHAIDAGLVDGVSTLDALVAQLAQRPGAGRLATPTPTRKAAMDQSQLQAEHPALAEKIRQEAHAAGIAAGIDQERARHAALDAAAEPAYAELTAQAKAEGWDAGRYALAVLAAEKEERAQALANLRADAPKPVPVIDGREAEMAAAAKPTQAGANALGKRAKELIAQAEAEGRALGATEAVAKAKAELAQ